MKPKTKLQMEIVNGSRKLAPVSEAQKRYAYKHCFVHYFKRDAKGNCFCLDCGHTWRDKEDKKNCKCPHCGMNLKLENSRKRTAVYKEYFLCDYYIQAISSYPFFYGGLPAEKRLSG